MKRNKRNRKKHIGYNLKRRYKDAIKKQLQRELFLLSKKDIESFDTNIPPLNKNDSLFVEREEGNQYYIDSDMYIQNGYVSTSAILLHLISLSNDRYLRECYIYPVMFCFRQYLELTMKDSILYCRLRRKVAYSGESNLEGHNLLVLWDNLKLYLDANDSVVKNVQRIIMELNSVDSNGELFRYGSILTKKVLDKNVEMPLIDVSILFTRIIQLYRFFEGINLMARNGFDEIIGNQ